MSDIKCVQCKKRIGENEAVVPVLRVVANDRRGDFVGNGRSEYIHLKHLMNEAR